MAGASLAANMWRYVCATAQGVSHERLGLPCQDRCEIDSHGRWVFAALSDGAGSAVHAAEGAELAVKAAMIHLAELARSRRIGPEELRTAAHAARKAIAGHAGANGDVRAYACTLQLIALSDKGGAALQIGDGLIAMNQGQDGWEYVFWPQRGEFTNTTYFVTDVNAPDQWEVTELPPSAFEFALMSDGLEVLALNYGAKRAHSPFFEGLLPAVRKSAADGQLTELSGQLYTYFLMSERVRQRTDDDLSLVLAARTPHVDHELP
jgi:hypothetical protein